MADDEILNNQELEAGEVGVFPRTRWKKNIFEIYKF